MTDECARLRADLEAGRWRRLTDPLLDLTVLEQPACWAAIVQACAMTITDEATQRADVPALRWTVRAARWLRLGQGPTATLLAQVPRSPSLSIIVARRALATPPGGDPERAARHLRLAQAALEHCQDQTGPAPDLEAAVAVLARFTSPGRTS